MQDTNFDSAAQTVAVPSSMLELFKQSLQVRLEAYAFNSTSVLDCFHEHNTESVKNHLQLTILELNYLLNEFELLDLLSAKA